MKKAFDYYGKSRKSAIICKIENWGFFDNIKKLFIDKLESIVPPV